MPSAPERTEEKRHNSAAYPARFANVFSLPFEVSCTLKGVQQKTICLFELRFTSTLHTHDTLYRRSRSGSPNGRRSPSSWSMVKTTTPLFILPLKTCTAAAAADTGR